MDLLFHLDAHLIGLLDKVECPLGGRLHSGEHEENPRFPLVVPCDGVETFVVGVLVTYDVPREIEDRKPQQFGLNQDQHVEDAPRATVAVEEGVDGLELVVGKCHEDEGIESVVAVDEALPC